jgi:hypothetical protein
MSIIDIRKSLFDAKTKIFETLVNRLDSYKDEPLLSRYFLVESNGDMEILIRYPGNKMNRRSHKRIPSKILWQNLYDFLVVPKMDGKEYDIREFTYKALLSDFEKNKIRDDKFWNAIIEVYKENYVISDDFSKLEGIPPALFLLVLKWLWIQEDLNYKYSWKDVNAPTRYTNEKTGLGRGKFFGALVLVKSGYFSAEDCIKLTSLY